MKYVIQLNGQLPALYLLDKEGAQWTNDRHQALRLEENEAAAQVKALSHADGRTYSVMPYVELVEELAMIELLKATIEASEDVHAVILVRVSKRGVDASLASREMNRNGFHAALARVACDSVQMMIDMRKSHAGKECTCPDCMAKRSAMFSSTKAEA